MENFILLLLRKRKYGTIRDRSEGRNLIVEIFSERLVKARKKRQLTQKAAAALIGIQASSLSAYEGGRKTPSVEIAMQIAKAYEVSLDWLVGNANAVENTTDNEVLFKIETKGEFIRVLSSLCMSPIQLKQGMEIMVLARVQKSLFLQTLIGFQIMLISLIKLPKL